MAHIFGMSNILALLATRVYRNGLRNPAIPRTYHEHFVNLTTAILADDSEYVVAPSGSESAFSDRLPGSS